MLNNTNNIACLVVTKDRASQYESCVKSLRLNFPPYLPIYTLYKCSDVYNLKRYGQIFIEYGLIDEATRELEFQNCLFYILSKIAQKYEFVLLMTDDEIFYKHLDIDTNTLLSPFRDKSLLTLSLRLGKNTTIQDIDNPYIPLEVPQTKWNDNFYMWDWTKQPLSSNCGYPVSFDGHIYKTADILSMTESIEFTNLREWEGRLIEKTVGNPLIKPMMACPIYSHCVNIPLNMVNPPYYNKIGPFGLSIKELDTLFDNSNRIDLIETFDNINVVGSHQYIKLKFKHI